MANPLHLPLLQLPHAPASLAAGPGSADWPAIPALPPLLLADGSRPAGQQTSVRACADARALYVRFDCDDRDIWATYTRRDQPIYGEEVVELFIAPGIATPTSYYEIEVSPDGVLFDARIENPTGLRADITVDTSWDCPGIVWQAGRDDQAGRWWAVLVLPWQSIAGSEAPPREWRANFYRIERPRDGQPEYSCWSPTMTEPADFHKPAYFGLLERPVGEQ